jgi:putative NADPH-quinone reductase
MNVFLVHAHAEPQSFNGALFRTAQETLRAAGHVVAVGKIHRAVSLLISHPLSVIPNAVRNPANNIGRDS